MPLTLVVVTAIGCAARVQSNPSPDAPVPISFGAAVTNDNVTLLIGGSGEGGTMHSAVMRVDDCGRTIRVVASKSPFEARSFFPALSVDHRLYLFGGFQWAPPSNVLGDVWSSANGTDWRHEAVDPAWEAREAHGVVHHNGHFYLFGGVTYFRPEKSAYTGADNPNHLRLFGDVWESLDGFTWTLLIEKAPWGPRRSFGYATKDGYIWLWGGVNDESATTFNDVWRTRDGVSWELVTPAAPWSPRAPTNVAPLFAGKLWVIGGDALLAPPGENWHRQRKSHGLNDIWSSIDGMVWEQVTAKAAFPPRTGAYVFEMQCGGESMLGLYGGNNDTLIGQGVRTFFHDVWVSRDGRAWHLIASRVETASSK